LAAFCKGGGDRQEAGTKGDHLIEREVVGVGGELLRLDPAVVRGWVGQSIGGIDVTTARGIDEVHPDCIAEQDEFGI
jgi:hypothetical protein